MHRLLPLIALFLLCTALKGQKLQVKSGVADPNASVIFDISSTNGGILVPRMTSAQREAIINPVMSLMVFDTTLEAFCFYNGQKWLTLPTTEQMADLYMTEQEVQNYVNGMGLLSIEADGSIENEIQVLSRSADSIYLSRNGGVVKDSVLTEAIVDQYVGNNGYLTSEKDSSISNELQTISKLSRTVTLSNGGGSFQDSVLTEEQVDAYANNNGYLTSEKDSSVTNELQTIVKVARTVTLSDNGGSFQDSVLTEEQVDAYASNNGYLTSEKDSSVTNELQTISRNGLTVSLSDGGGSFQDSVLSEQVVDEMVDDNGFFKLPSAILYLGSSEPSPNGTLRLGWGNATSRWNIETETIDRFNNGFYYNYNGDLLFRAKQGNLFDAPQVEVMRMAYTGGVGIGTGQDVSAKLVVQDSSSTEANVIKIGNISTAIGAEANLQFYQNQFTQGLGKIGSYITANSPIESDLRFSTVTAGDWNEDAMVLKSNGNLGLGTNNPGSKLHLKSNDPEIYFQDDEGAGAHFSVTGANGFGRLISDQSIVMFIDSDNNDSAQSFAIEKDASSFSGNNSNLLTVLENGNVGIGGERAPNSTLDVKGKVSSDSLIVKAGAQNNYVLTSDATGLGRWVEPNSLINNDNDWALDADTVSVASNKYVGIGTSSPSHTLTVEGSTFTNSLLSKGSFHLAPYEAMPNAQFDIGWGNGTSKWQVLTESDGTYDYNGNLLFKSKVGDVWNAPLVEQLRMTYEGNIGINTGSTVSAKLVIQDSKVGEANILKIGNTNKAVGAESNILFYQNQSSQGTGKIGAYITDVTEGSFDSDLRFSTIKDGNWNEDALVVKGSGKVGIGTTEPSSYLHIKASVEDLTPSGPSIGSHVMVIENTATLHNDNILPDYANMDTSNIQLVNTNSNNGLAINLNAPQYHLDTKNHFISFYRDANNLAGRIEGEHTADFLQLRQLIESTISGLGSSGGANLLEFDVTFNENFINWVPPTLEGGSLPSLNDDGFVPQFSPGSFPTLTGGSFPSLTGGSFPTLTGGSFPTLQGGSLPSLGVSYQTIGLVGFYLPTGGLNSGSFQTLTEGSFPSLTGGSFQTLTGGSFQALAGGVSPSFNSTALNFPTINPGVFPTINPGSLTFSEPFSFGDPFIKVADDVMTQLNNELTDLLSTWSGIGATLIDAHDNFSEFSGTRLLLDQSVVLANTLTSGGVTYQSGSGDYAEWLEMADPSEIFYPGDVVGVHAGKISHQVENADHVMVISVDPIVLGNTPKEGEEQNYKKVAFMGQVPVRTYGQVRQGDILIARSDESGEAYGVDPSEVTPKELLKSVGVAWTDSYNDNGVSYVKASVGLRSQDMSTILLRQQNEINELKKELNEIKDLKSELATIKEALGL